MFCSNCGKEVSDNQRFCCYCGSENKNYTTISDTELLSNSIYSSSEMVDSNTQGLIVMY